MLPFTIDLKPGVPVAEQILFAVRRAVVTGQLRAGDRFPSVRVLSEELRINPNTAHKVVAALVDEGVLLTTPGVGSVVAEAAPGDRREQSVLLGERLERLAVDARHLGLSLDEVRTSLERRWRALDEREATRPPSSPSRP